MADPNNTVSLLVGGKVYKGWLNVSISCALMSVARSFKVGCTRSLSSLRSKSLGIEAGDEVVVKIGDDPVLTGFVTEIDLSYSANEISITISGASKTINLEDCTMPPGVPKSYRNVTFAQGIEKLCAPFGISLTDKLQSSEKTTLEVSVTETVSQFLQKFLRKNSILVTDDEKGGLIIATTKNAELQKDRLELGKNVLKGSFKTSIRKRHRKYYAIGQAANPKSEQPTTGSSGVYLWEDPDFPLKERVKVFKEEGNASSKILGGRAKTYCDFSIAESETLNYTVNGWRQSSGDLWKVNTLVTIVDSFSGLKTERLVSKVTFNLSNSGTTTEIELKPSDAFLVLDEPDKTKAITGNSQFLAKKDSGKVS